MMCPRARSDTQGRCGRGLIRLCWVGLGSEGSPGPDPAIQGVEGHGQDLSQLHREREYDPAQIWPGEAWEVGSRRDGNINCHCSPATKLPNPWARYNSWAGRWVPPLPYGVICNFAKFLFHGWYFPCLCLPHTELGFGTMNKTVIFLRSPSAHVIWNSIWNSSRVRDVCFNIHFSIFLKLYTSASHRLL